MFSFEKHNVLTSSKKLDLIYYSLMFLYLIFLMPNVGESFELVSKEIVRSQCPLKLSKGRRETMCGIINCHAHHFRGPDSKKTALDHYGNGSILKTAVYICIYLCMHSIYSHTD